MYSLEPDHKYLLIPIMTMKQLYLFSIHY